MQIKTEGRGRRVVLVYWKNNTTDAFEVFSNLKIFCARYPVYSYNTMSNYLSKQKIAYEDEHVYVERKRITSAVGGGPRVLPVVRKGPLHELKNKEVSGREKDLAHVAKKNARVSKKNARKK